ncbi:phosphoenolpyruvate--protein phosphotransferase [Magnetovibrio blakemorei]|uniref:Phosphoenolpyruvate-protein phosphotransferase n=1 Tax=Magnetovibrio blakemorei TaxID=28181 RepID=A0A1E5QBA4_9PROT|nr:phosphoenolpyruvate--protein phosphotransferase [Magnetovibrio blakemorei]OEJ69310.1 phosphoenolpyruvate--protein phosphotransferase [Magnetovibrio blakemorei]
MSPAAKSGPKEIILHGLGVSPGVAIGYVHVRESGSIAVPEYSVRGAQIEEECTRLDGALQTAQRQIGRLQAKAATMPAAAAEEMGFLLEAYQQMLKDSRLVRGAYRRIRDDKINAEAAVQAEIKDITTGFEALDDTYIAARMDDIREVAYRLIRALTKSHVKPLNTVRKGAIIISEEMTPADTAQLNPDKVSGFATVLGGAQGHTAIMARALGLPAVLGAAGLLGHIQSGDHIVIDGDQGRIVINPKPATLAAFEAKQAKHRRTLSRLTRLRRQPSVTRDGTEISLGCNVELPIEMPGVLDAGASSIGLLRSEFMFMNRDDIPGEEEQYKILRDIVKAMDGRTVTVRTLDIGGEKLAESLTQDIGDSAQSALGLRGIRLSLKKPDLFEAQLTAILRAGAHGPVRILLPMVCSQQEVRTAREILMKLATKLKRKKVKIADKLPPMGVMIEVPSAALTADALASVSDFFAIGSNDLTMYTMAVDRTDEQVAALYNPLHPSVLRLIQFTTEAALRARIPISLCGEMAGDPRYTALLMGLGIRELSMSAHALGPVKQRVREIDLAAAQNRATVIMGQTDSGRIAMLLDDFNALV